jgi:hypothetical protein
MSVEKEHEEKNTLQVDVDLPGHAPRVTTALFRKTKRMLMTVSNAMGFDFKREAGQCWICGKTEADLGQPLEAHHFGIERAYIDAKIRWDLVARDFPIFGWKGFDPAKPEEFVDNMAAQGVLLCKAHHTGKDSGIHCLPFSLWLMQKYLADGTRFSPTEVIRHADGDDVAPTGPQ